MISLCQERKSLLTRSSAARQSGYRTIVFRQILAPQIHVRGFVADDPLPPQFLHQAILMRPMHPLHPPLRLRRTGGDQLHPQLPAHAPIAVILDGFSRKVVGWAVDRTMMSSRLTVAALERAVADRQPQAGLVHHSDRGLQYASPEYVTSTAWLRA
jgi:transposase InsO family protein